MIDLTGINWKNNAVKVFFLVLMMNAIENITLLWFFGVSIGKRTIIGAFIFSIVVSFLINKIMRK